MNLTVFERDKEYVRDRLRAGEIDHLETVSEGAETEFFKYLDQRGILKRLAKSYPLQKKKTEVPLWLYIASELSLRLHGMQSFHGYPFVIRTGGLLNAFGPEVGKKAVHPQTGQVTIQCPGFNDKNRHDRQTPCDQDWLRKTAKATEAKELFAWFNAEMARCLAQEKLYDPEGIFVGDGSYVFVPDNAHYERSVVMLFDEHNHPVNEAELTPDRRRRCRFRRCYKWVELLHTNSRGDFYFFVGMALGPGNGQEGPILYGLVETFLRTVGRGVMKWLVVDRGFLDGARIGHLKTEWGVETVVALRSNMNVLEDARGLLRMEKKPAWQEYRPRLPELLEVGPLGVRPPAPPAKPAPPEKVIAFNELRSWDACPVPLTVVLTRERGKLPWGIATTAATQNAPLIRHLYHLRETIEERHRQTKVFCDLANFHSTSFNLISNQVVFVALMYTLMQMKMADERRPELNHLTLQSLRYQLRPYDNHLVVYAQQYYAFFDAPEYTELVMTIEEPGKTKLLRKVRRIRREYLGGLKLPRSP